MAFEFKRKESVRSAVKRCAQNRIDNALKALHHCERLEAVHEIRKDIKKIRALLRLVRPAMPKSVYARSADLLRDAARPLGDARDAHIKVTALNELAGHFKAQLSPQPLRPIKHLLAEACRQQQARLSHKQTPRKAERSLEKLSRELSALNLKDSGWSAIGPGLKRSYVSGRRGCRLARRSGTPEHFHEWRKRVKDLYYQITLLGPIWREQICAAAAELEHLGEYLGEDHDLFLLSQTMTGKDVRKNAGAEAAALGALVNVRQQELRAKALALGTKFYAEKASAFCERLRCYWRRWREKPRSVARI